MSCDLRPAQLSERDLSDNIVALARMLGYRVHRDPMWRPTGTDAGFPDLTLARIGRLVFLELKSKHGKLSGEQEHWRACLEGNARLGTLEYYVIRPADWYAGTVEEILT